MRNALTCDQKYGECRKEDPLLTPQHRQGAISRAFIQAVAGRCGMSCSFRDFDYGIDMTLNDIKHYQGRRVETGFKLDIQAKSSVTARVEESEVIYSMEVKTYNDLRDASVGTPRILVLLVLPRDEEQWVRINQRRFMIRRSAYWLSLRGEGGGTHRERVTVSIPRGNLFTVESLKQIMDSVKRGEDL